MPIPPPIRCLLVEDETPAVEIFQNYISHFEGFELTAHVYNAFDAMEYLAGPEVDVLFVDIQLPGMTGLDLLKSLHRPPLVIITSAYSEHGVQAYDLEVFDYLLKPYSLERFARTLNRIRHHLEKNQGPNSDPLDEQMIFRVQRKDRKVHLRDIRFVESQREYVEVVTTSDRFRTKIGIGHLIKQLPHPWFIRVHRSFIVNQAWIRAFGARKVDLGDFEIPIGTLYRKEAESAWRSFRQT